MPDDDGPGKRDPRVPRARQLRRSMTDAERKLWRRLSELPLPASHFRRQASIGPYFADFACHGLRLVVELDGGQHAETEQGERDARRTECLESRGYRVLRFWNNDVLNETEGVLSVIHAAAMEQAATPPTPDPSPPRASRAGGGEPREPGEDPALRRRSTSRERSDSRRVRRRGG